MSDARRISVSNLSPTSTESSVRAFFSFCGHVESIQFESASKSATITFAKPGAAKTAAFLNGASLDGSSIDVRWEGEGKSEAADTAMAHTQSAQEGGDIKQDDKPRSAVAAEYLANGYQLSDQAINSLIELDNKHGVSQRFQAFWAPLQEKAMKKVQELDQQHHISEQASQKYGDADERYKLSEKAASASSIGRAYYERALASGFGQQVQNFYTNAATQVQDVHNEARRIADSRKPAAPAPAAAATGGALPASGTATSAPAASGYETTTAPSQTTATAPVTDIK